MDPFQMVVAIVLIVTIGSVVRARHGVVRKGEQLVNPGDAAENAALRAEVRALKDRVAVLERIATDANQAVALDREIERLRDR